jgi:cell division septum initiation protein DivIVA
MDHMRTEEWLNLIKENEDLKKKIETLKEEIEGLNIRMRELHSELLLAKCMNRNN